MRGVLIHGEMKRVSFVPMAAIDVVVQYDS